MQKFSSLFPQGVPITQRLDLKENLIFEGPIYNGLQMNVG